MTIIPPYNVKEGDICFEFISESNFKVEKIENIIPYDFVDRYKPDRHGIITKEHIYSPDLVFSTFYLSLVKDDQGQSKIVKPKRNKSSTLDVYSNKNLKLKSAEKYNITPLEEKVRVIVEIYDYEDNLIYSDSGYNSIIIHNLLLKGVPYIPPENEDKKKKLKEKDKKLIETDRSKRILI